LSDIERFIVNYRNENYNLNMVDLHGGVVPGKAAFRLIGTCGLMFLLFGTLSFFDLDSGTYLFSLAF